MKNPNRAFKDAIYEQFARIGKAVSIQAVEMLRAKGFKAVRIEEGIQDFRAMGFPITVNEEV
jgi:hypothetical protein